MLAIPRQQRRKLSDLPPDAIESDSYGPINKILSKSFTGKIFEVAVQSAPLTNRSNSVDLIVKYKGEPVLFLEGKAPYRLSQLSARAEADRHFDQLTNIFRESPL